MCMLQDMPKQIVKCMVKVSFDGLANSVKLKIFLNMI